MEKMYNNIGVSCTFNGKLMREIRTQRGLSLDKLAKLTGVTKAALQRYETGATQKVSCQTVAVLERVLSCKLICYVGTVDCGICPRQEYIEFIEGRYKTAWIGLKSLIKDAKKPYWDGKYTESEKFEASIYDRILEAMDNLEKRLVKGGEQR